MEFVAADRRTESLAAYYDALTETQRAALQAVATDMWPAYIRATVDGLPQGDQKIVFDRFHIMREMTRAVDTVRKQEHRAFLAAGEASPLTRTKYLWLRSDEHLTTEQAEALALLHTHGLQVSRAWAITESLRAVDRPSAGGGHALLRSPARLGHPLAPRPREARRPHDHAASRRRAALRAAPDHQRRRRGPQQQDHEHQAQGGRLPKPRALHDRDLLPSRGIGPLPTLTPEEASI